MRAVGGLVVVLLIAAVPLHGDGAAVAAPELVPGRALHDIEIVDDGGRVRSTVDWRGTPTILAPIYTRCPLACPLIAEALKRAAADAKASPTSYRVVLFSFDPRDTPEKLRTFRDLHRLPLGWTLATAARPGDARRLLDSIGYHYAEAGGQFIHPNAVMALTANLTTAKTMIGTTYDIDEALAVARGGTDWIDRYGGWALALTLFVALLAVIYLVSRLPRGEREKVDAS
jgi:cytochrome oxidase Cu insertion factor (SCO1/SenC/PrrC family)